MLGCCVVNNDTKNFRGMGSALGGGAADQVLGAGSAAQLTKMTVWDFGLFCFVLCTICILPK